MSLRVCHLVRPAEGGMLSQVRSLLDESSLLAAPPSVLAALSDRTTNAPYPLSASGGIRAQWRDGKNVGRWAKNRADVLHGHGLARSLLFSIAAKTSKLPLVITFHNLVPKLSPLERIIARIALSRARKIICVSEAVAQSASQIVPSHKKIVIHNGIVPPSPVPHGGESEAEARGKTLRGTARPILSTQVLTLESHGNMLEQRANMLESHTNVLERHEDLSEQRTNRAQSHTNMLERHEDLPERPANTSESHGNVSKQRVKMQVYCVSRLSPEKGIDILLEAARKLPEIDFLIAGDGPEREILENSSSPNVTFLGFVKDIPDLLSQADVLCVPSRSEGLGLAALEAMAAGVPVVASRVGGLPEVILDGETGLLFTSEDPEALKIALQTLLDNPERRKAMGEAGRKRAESVFDAKTMQKKTRAVWEEAAR